MATSTTTNNTKAQETRTFKKETHLQADKIKAFVQCYTHT